MADSSTRILMFLSVLGFGDGKIIKEMSQWVCDYCSMGITYRILLSSSRSGPRFNLNIQKLSSLCLNLQSKDLDKRLTL